MEDLEKQLAPFIDKFNEAKLGTDRERDNKKTKEMEFKDEFKSISVDRIKPIMEEYETYLKSKNQQ